MGKVFSLPGLGENIEAADVIRVMVAEGDLVTAEQTVLEMETEKAMFEVPIPFAGKVTQVHVKAGDRVPVGATLITLEEAEGVESSPPVSAPLPVRAEAMTAASSPAPAPLPPAPVPAAASPVSAPAPAPLPAGSEVAASPATRRVARELGVELQQVPGSEAGGRVVVEDVYGYVRQRLSGAAPGGEGETRPLPDFSRWGPIERQAVRSVRKATGDHVARAWRTIPHVTQFDRADVTDLEAMRKRHTAAAEAMGGKLTSTVFVLKAVVAGLKAFPRFNSSLDAQAGELVLKKYYHVGMAVDTDRGLLVPVIRDVDQKGILDLARELVEISERTRQGKVTLEEMQGGSFTISNLGSIGGTGFTPIVNHPEVAILGVSRSREEAVVRNGEIQIRTLMPLSLSYDHRVVDGAEGVRFIRRVAELLENAERILLEG